MQMKNLAYLFLLSVWLFASCSSGKKALQKGEYFSAVSKAVKRLNNNPGNKNAKEVIRESYPLAIQWSQEEIDMMLSGADEFKWDKTLGLMQKVNIAAREIRQSPVARQIIPEPKTYTSEMEVAKQNAAEERYKAGNRQLAENTLESGRMAFRNFRRANEILPGYKDVAPKMVESKNLATIKVVLEAIPVHTATYKLSSELFYQQVFEFLNNKYPERSFVNIYSPQEAERVGLEYPDFIVRLQFYDFVVGKTDHYEKEELLTKRVEVETRDTTKTTYKNYKAKLKTFTDKVASGGVLDMQVIDFNADKVMVNDRIPGEFVWIYDHAIYVGDKEALTKEQFELTKRKAVPLPPAQDLFIEFTKPIYDQLTGRLRRFLNKYD